MTVPEENRAKTDTTDEILENRQNQQHRRNRPSRQNQGSGQERDDDATRTPGGTGRTLREALEEARVRPDDYDEK